MASFIKFNPFVENLSESKFNLSSDATATVTVALTNAANPPIAANGVLADLTEISYTNLSARVVTITSSSQTAGTYKLVLVDLVLTASATVPAFRYVVIYDDDAPADELIGFYDYGADVVLNIGDTFTTDFSPTNGVLQLA